MILLAEQNKVYRREEMEFILDTINPTKQSYKLVILNANSLNQLDDVKIYIEGKQIING